MGGVEVIAEEREVFEICAGVFTNTTEPCDAHDAHDVCRCCGKDRHKHDVEIMQRMFPEYTFVQSRVGVKTWTRAGVSDA